MLITENARGSITLANGTTYTIDNTNICGDLTISKQCVSGSGFELGGVCSAQLQMTVKIQAVSRYQLIGAVISLEIFKGNQWYNFGIYNVTSASRYKDIITISASDSMVVMDNSAYGEDERNHKLSLIAEFVKTARSPFEILSYIVETAGLELSQTQEEIETMPNGTLNTILCQEISTDCPRDWLSWISEYLSGFAYVDENGKIAIKQFESVPTATITAEEIQSDSSDVADFQILLARVGVVNYDKTWGYWYYTENDGKPNTINIDLSENLFAQGRHFLTHNSMDMMENIFDTIDLIEYRPFTATVHSDKIFNLGQCIEIEDCDGSLHKTVITHINFTLNGGWQLKCTGEDTRLLANTKSRTALKRQTELLQAKIEEAKGVNITQAEFDTLLGAGKLIENRIYNIIG